MHLFVKLHIYKITYLVDLRPNSLNLYIAKFKRDGQYVLGQLHN